MATRSKPRGKTTAKKRRNPDDPPPPPTGEANPQSRDFMRERARAAEARAVVMEAEIAELRAKLAEQSKVLEEMPTEEEGTAAAMTVYEHCVREFQPGVKS